ncbi:MAG: VOC family protein [Gammaproteobacteria bacterium]|nr:VOC family protein [Gammaproteobacteria bacterium]
MDIIGIGYLGFETPDLEAWRDYGPQVLGMGIGENPEDDPDSLYLRMDDRRYRLAFHRGGKVDRVLYIGWEALNRTAFREAIDKFTAADVAITHGDAALCARRGVRELIRFRDPAGFQHELFYGQKWSPRSFTPGRPHTGFQTDGRGLGHVVLMIPEFPQAHDDFLIKLMGFTWYGSGAGKGKTGFYRARLNNSTSHDIGYGLAPGRKGIQHIGLFVNAVRDVGETYDIVRKRGLKMQMTLGEHTQDPHISFYHFSPSGFAIECICELEPWQPDGFELNPDKLSKWGHELVGPIIGPSVLDAKDYPAD